MAYEDYYDFGSDSGSVPYYGDQYSQPAPTPEPNQASNEDLLATLLQASMSRGLGLNDMGQVNFSGPVAGYSGPLNQNDIPSLQASADIPVYYGETKPGEGIHVSPATQQARVQNIMQQQIPGMTGPATSLEQLIPLVQSLKGLDDNTQAAILSKLGVAGIGSVGDPVLERQKALAQFQHGLNAPDRQTAQMMAMARLREAMNSAAERQRQWEEKNRIPYNAMIEQLKNAREAGVTDPTALGERARAGGWYYQGGTTDVNPFSSDFSPRIGTTPVYQAPSGPTAPARPMAPATQSKTPMASAQPAPGDRVRVTAPNGQPGSVPRAQLKAFLDRGFKESK